MDLPLGTRYAPPLRDNGCILSRRAADQEDCVLHIDASEAYGKAHFQRYCTTSYQIERGGPIQLIAGPIDSPIRVESRHC